VLPPAAAAAAFVGDLQAGVADGQVTRQAGQDLFGHLQQALFGPPARTDPGQVRQQYAQLVRAYDQHRAQGQVTGPAAAALRHALGALGSASRGRARSRADRPPRSGLTWPGPVRCSWAAPVRDVDDPRKGVFSD